MRQLGYRECSKLIMAEDMRRSPSATSLWPGAKPASGIAEVSTITRYLLVDTLEKSPLVFKKKLKLLIYFTACESVIYRNISGFFYNH